MFNRAGTLFGMTTSASSGNYTSLALDSFFKNTRLTSQDRVILIDNDNAWPNTVAPLVSIIKNPQPKTFSENVNFLIGLAKEYNQDLVFLSNDIILTPGWLEPLELLNTTLTIPSCNQTHQYRFNSLELKPNLDFEEYNDAYDDLCKIVDLHRTNFTPLIKAYDMLLMPFYLFRLPKEIYNTLGNFDDKFINGGEDIDYRIRCLLRGFDVKYMSQSYVLHFNGKSTWRGQENLEQRENRNKLYKQRLENKWGEDLRKLLTLGEDPNDVLRKYALMKFDPRHDSFNELIKTVWKLSR